MTCIVGIIENEKVYIGADSAAASGLDISIRKDPKVFKVGEFVMGCTTSFRMIQLLRYSLETPPIEDKELYEFMCTDFIKAVRKCFSKNGWQKKDTDGEEKGGSFLVGVRGRLFCVYGDFQVAEPADQFHSIGCGSSYALGAIEASLFSSVHPRTLIFKALNIAVKFSGGVAPPFTCEVTETIKLTS